MFPPKSPGSHLGLKNSEMHQFFTVFYSFLKMKTLSHSNIYHSLQYSSDDTALHLDLCFAVSLASITGHLLHLGQKYTQGLECQL